MQLFPKLIITTPSPSPSMMAKEKKKNLNRKPRGSSLSCESKSVCLQWELLILFRWCAHTCDSTLPNSNCPVWFTMCLYICAWSQGLLNCARSMLQNTRYFFFCHTLPLKTKLILISWDMLQLIRLAQIEQMYIHVLFLKDYIIAHQPTKTLGSKLFFLSSLCKNMLIGPTSLIYFCMSLDHSQVRMHMDIDFDKPFCIQWWHMMDE